MQNQEMSGIFPFLCMCVPSSTAKIISTMITSSSLFFFYCEGIYRHVDFITQFTRPLGDGLLLFVEEE